VTQSRRKVRPRITGLHRATFARRVPTDDLAESDSFVRSLSISVRSMPNLNVQQPLKRLDLRILQRFSHKFD